MSAAVLASSMTERKLEPAACARAVVPSIGNSSGGDDMASKLWRTAAAALAVLTATATQASEADRPEALVLSGRIIDGSGAAPVSQGRVVAIDGVITCVGKASDCPIPSGAVVIDAGDGSIIPGLIDLHAHPRPHYYGWFLASGVTTVRSANTDLAMVRALKALPA